MSYLAVILAAGEGKRMGSNLPKVLHRCAGIPMVCHAVRNASGAGASDVVVVVSPSNAACVEAALEADKGHWGAAQISYAVQETPRGTGDAVRAALAARSEVSGRVVVLCGDTPLLPAKLIHALNAEADGADLAMMTAHVASPAGYGRVVRRGDKVARIVEDKDISDPAEREITEINASVYGCDAEDLRCWLERLRPDNAQGELYLTDIVQLAIADGKSVAACCAENVSDVLGVNTPQALAEAEAEMRRRLVSQHMSAGVRFVDPSQVWLDCDVAIQPGAQIGLGVQLWGNTRVEGDAVIEGPAVLSNCHVGRAAQVFAFSHLDAAAVGSGATVGPFARLRPGTKIGEQCKVGNFVELKNAELGRGSKASHLAYLGDTVTGEGCNIGAGTITCNYDGYDKHQTVLGDGVFVGSNATLIAPLKLGDRAYVGAGTIVTDDVQKDALVIGRARQRALAGYGLRLRERLAARKAAKVGQKR